MKIRSTKIKYYHIERYYYICKAIKMFSIMSNLQTHYHFKLDCQEVDQHTGGNGLIHGIKHHKDNQLLSCKAWNSAVKHPSRECKHDIKGSESNPISKENVQVRKHLGNCTFVEPKLRSYRKPKFVVQNENNGHKNTNSSHNYHDENHDEIELYQGNRKMST